ncbi:hypothetical protein ACROYT_G022475 [Oculina patagonica]
MIGKLTKLHADYRSDPETRDRDTELKAKTKACADQAANVKPSDIQVGDRVLVRSELDSQNSGDDEEAESGSKLAMSLFTAAMAK